MKDVYREEAEAKQGNYLMKVKKWKLLESKSEWLLGESESCSVVSNSLWPHGLCGILQARILEWVAFSFSVGSSQPRDRTQVSCIAGEFFTSWATGEAQEYWSGYLIPSPADLPDPGIEPGSPALQAIREVLHNGFLVPWLGTEGEP